MDIATALDGASVRDFHIAQEDGALRELALGHIDTRNRFNNSSSSLINRCFERLMKELKR
jgi:hypothetical protein